MIASALAALLLAAPAPARPGDLELAGTWALLGEPDLALGVARDAAMGADASWREHALYAELSGASPSASQALAEYRWLAARDGGTGDAALLLAWAEFQQAGAAAREEPLRRLETFASAGSAGRELFARALLRAGQAARAAQVLEHDQGPEALAVRIEALVACGDERRAAGLALRALDAHPRRPDLAVALFAPGLEPRGELGRARRVAQRAARDLLGADDLGSLLRAWRTLAWARDEVGAARAAAAVARKNPGLALPPRPPWGAAMLRQLGEGLARTGQERAEMPLTAAEQAAVARARAVTLRDDGLVDQARHAWAQAVEDGAGSPAFLLDGAALVLPADPGLALAWIGLAQRELALHPVLDAALEARALGLEARCLLALGRPDPALVDLALAAALVPGPEALVELARAQEAGGGREGALWSLARAAALGAPGLEPELARLYRGPASPEALVEAARLAPSPAEIAVRPVAPPAEPRAVDRVLSTTDGDLSLVAWRGQVVVLAFWASWCQPCAEELPALARLEAAWRQERLAARILAVSVDEDEAGWRRGRARFEALGIPLAWSPELAAELGVRAVPAVQLLDRAGRPAGRLQGFDPGQERELEARVRGLLQP